MNTDAYERIQQAAIERAQKRPDPVEDYIEGLKVMITLLQEELEAAEESQG